MPMTFTKSSGLPFEDVWGRVFVRVLRLTLSGLYPLGGYAVSAQGVGLKALGGVHFVNVNTAGRAYRPIYNGTAGAVQLLTSAGGAGDVEPVGVAMTGVEYLAIFAGV